MSRFLTEYSSNHITEILNSIIDPALPPDSYRQAMTALGKCLGQVLINRYKNKSFYIVTATEDADFLAKGLLDTLAQNEAEASFSCFWNNRQTFSSLDDYQLNSAPNLRKYIEPNFKRDILVILKSIISSGCVVKYNILSITSKIDPQEIAIISPVLLKGSDSELRSEFPANISEKFSFITFAVDDIVLDGIVKPGIGGNVYERLGFQGQEGKNRITPQIVKERRHSFA